MQEKIFLLKNETSIGSHKNSQPKTLNSTVEKKRASQ